jgi:hypothetical protein
MAQSSQTDAAVCRDRIHASKLQSCTLKLSNEVWIHDQQEQNIKNITYYGDC